MFNFISELKNLDKIFNSSYRIALTILAITSVYSLNLIFPTNSFYSDKATSEDNTFTAGYWIPELSYSVLPAEPDGEDGWYLSTPCVNLSAVIGDSHDGITIYYKFSHDGDPVSGGTEYKGTCVNIPDGEWDFEAQAVNDENPSDWRSNIVKLSFKVETTDISTPEWDSPKNNIWTHQTKNIKFKWQPPSSGTVDGYLFEVNEPEDGSGWKEPYSSCGLIDTNHVPTSQSCFDSDDVKLNQGDGKYKRRVKAVNLAGGESDWSEPSTINLDTESPVTQAKSAKIDHDNPGKIVVDYNAQDNSGGAGIKSVSLYYRFYDEDGYTSDWKLYGKDTSSNSKINVNIAEAIGSVETVGNVTFEFYTIGEDLADDLTAADMIDGSNGDNDQGNFEVKTPISETSVIFVKALEEPPCEGKKCDPNPGLMPMSVKSELKDKNEVTNEESTENSPAEIEKTALNDKTAPASQIKKVKKRSGKKNQGKFKFTLSARDIDSGVEKIEVYYRKGDEDWKKFGETDTNIFKSEKLDRGVYEFYSIAVDKAGNSEQKDNPKAEAQITITKDKTTIEILTGEKKIKKAKHKKSGKKKSEVKKATADKKKIHKKLQKKRLKTIKKP